MSDILTWLNYIDPSSLNYQEWLNVGMALKYEGYTANIWDEWSRKDSSRFHTGECYQKWGTFQNSGVTGGTIYQLAVNAGWTPSNKGYELEWDSTIKNDEYVIIDKNWVEGMDIEEPEDSSWNPVKEIITYLETLFDSNDNVGYVTSTYQKTDDKTGEIKYIPTSGNYDRTAGKLIEQLGKCKGDIGAVFGDYKEESGAWIRFNPLDGKGVKNENVIDYRYALVESDSMDLETQNAIIRNLELPVACLVFSGKKSIHAIVKVHAQNHDEYKKRVNYLYNVCEKNGLKIDVQNRNCSRLSRMPGVRRNGHKQFLIDTNIGKKTWDEWFEWIEGINDDLPEPESLEEYWDNLPKLAPSLIDGVLRQGHKMLLAGPSKAGKSYALIELCIAIAEGDTWLGWDCAKGRVLYVNLELDRASCLHRFKDVYNSLEILPNSLNNIDIWNLRGKSVPMDKLAPKLIRRAQKRDYIAIVIDPIYKVITGDENSADQMAHFTNQFDKICTELGTAVIYCHHHSKGSQSNKKSMDRASGSGVFARDPDAFLDMVELELTDSLIENEINKISAKTIVNYLKKNASDYYAEEVSQDDELSLTIMQNHSSASLNYSQNKELEALKNIAIDKLNYRSAWRIEGTLREFKKFAPLNLWFDYPIHKSDDTGVLSDLNVEDESTWKKNFKNKRTPEQLRESRLNELEIAYSNLEMSGKIDITYADLVQETNKSLKTVKRYVKESPNFNVEIIDGKTTFIKRN